MHIGLNALNEQRYNRSLIQNPACIRCVSNYEDVMHYVLDCPHYAVPRIKLLEEFSGMNENPHVLKIAEKCIEMINLFYCNLSCHNYKHYNVHLFLITIVMIKYACMINCNVPTGTLYMCYTLGNCV